LPLSYSITIKKSAEKDLNKLPKKDRDKAVRIILGLAKKPRPKGCAKLKFKECWRVRFGDYRIIFEINDSARKIAVIGVKHRRDVYRR
jgi:mRNA interferase RelE/StbE